MRSNNILDTIGNTPLIEIKKLNPFWPKVRIFAKAEFLNPSGSIKDRMVRFALEQAEKRGELEPGMNLIEPTTGNTGAALAFIGGLKGYHVKVVVPRSTNQGKLKLMKFLGAEIIFVENGPTMTPVLIKAKKLATQNGYWLLNQFENPDNSLAFEELAEEIIREIEGPINYFVAGVGTGGTLMGVGKKLKAGIVAVEPAESAILSGGSAGFHQVEGIGEGFIPPLLDLNIVDQVVAIKSQQAQKLAQKLAQKEGLLVGTSSGANIAAALEIVPQAKGGTVVTVLPDRAERYL